MNDPTTTAPPAHPPTSDVAATLSDAEHDDLIRLAGLLDHATDPLPATLLPPERRLRAALDRLLARRGRTIVDAPAPDDAGDVRHVTTAVADDVADTLTASDVAVLDPTHRAVLALVLLHTVVGPTAAGHPPALWTAAARIPIAELKASAIPDRHVTAALHVLHLRGLLDVSPSAGVRLGSAIHRLTPRARTRIERDLVELVAGADPLIRRILQRLDHDDRRATPQAGVPGAFSAAGAIPPDPAAEETRP